MRTAVILAARKERDANLPYPLMPFYEDISLIDRTLSILREYNFSKIIIVTGYKSEMFKKYVADDVISIVNKEFAFTSSMASLAYAEEYIDEDFLLVEGDTFFEKILIEQLHNIREGNCFTITEESGSGDECFVETKAGFITKITKDRHRVARFEGELIGVSRISYPTYTKMLDAWNSADNPNLNYEYVLMDVTESIDRPFIRIKNLIWGDVDNKANFNKLSNYIYPRLKRKEDPFDLDNLISYLVPCFGEKSQSARIKQIGGLSNKNFMVEVDRSFYVLRVPGIGSEGMVNRKNEEQNSLLASKMGINPQIKYFNDQNGIKVADYIQNAETLNNATLQRKSNLRQIVDIYHRLHQSNVRFCNDFNVFIEIRKYEGLLSQTSYGEMYLGYERIRSSILNFENRLNDLGITLVPCHNDAVAENFIKDCNGKIWLIDWEYSGMNDPIWEFAALFLESEFDAESQDYFLDCYYQGCIPEVVPEKILIYSILQDILWSIWTVVKEAKGDDFGTYGIDRFQRAQSNYNKYEEIYGIKSK